MSACDISDSVRIQSGVAACPNCGSTALVERGLCLHCMLLGGLNSETETTETLKEVLGTIDVRDAEWRIGNYQILEEIGRGGMLSPRRSVRTGNLNSSAKGVVANLRCETGNSRIIRSLSSCSGLVTSVSIG